MTVARPAAPAATPPRAKRMTLDSVYSETKKGPFRVLIYGPEKVGKSSWAKDAPGAIFISGDNGLKFLIDPETGHAPKQFPIPESYLDIVDAVDELLAKKHDRKTLIIDPLGWIQPLVYGEFIRRNPKNEKNETVRTIDDYGFFKGQFGAVGIWRELLVKLERLQSEREMNVILVAHSEVKNTANPMGNEYEKYCIALDGGPKSERAAGLVVQWSDAVLFANSVTVTRMVKKKDKGIGTGTRALYTQLCDAYRAGNRYGLPSQLSLDFSEFYSHLKGEQLEETNADIANQLLAIVEGTEYEQSMRALVDSKPTTERLRVALNRAALKLQKTQENEETDD
jgi:hypothetical protein